MKKAIVVFFDKPSYTDYPFDDPEYATAYHELGRFLNERDADFAIARSMDTYTGGNSFTKHWLFDGQTFVEKQERIDADLIYDKGHFEGDENARTLNPLELVRICSNKFLTYQMFPEYYTRTLLAEDKVELRSCVDRIRSEIAVLKPQYGEEGKGVLITKKKQIPRSISGYPLVVQEFIDTSAGIPGIVESMHDFRIFVVNGEISLSYIRTPPDGSMRANVAQGGREIGVPIARIPVEAADIVRHVDQVFERFGRRVYTVDLGRGASGEWKIIELNSKPGLSESKRGREYKEFLEKLADVLVS